MFRGREIQCVNPDCPKQKFPASELLYLCTRGRQCRGFQKGERLPEIIRNTFPEDVVFSPHKSSRTAECTWCDTPAYLKVCPHCATIQRFEESHSTTIAVIGATKSGKTCFITALIKEILEELVKQARLSLSVTFEDDEGRQFYDAMHKTIFQDKKLPKHTQEFARVKAVRITVGVPLQGWRKRWNDFLLWSTSCRWGRKSREVSLVFPDPSGEQLKTDRKAYGLSYLPRARAVILLVDPFASSRYQQSRKEQGLAGDDQADDPMIPLGSVGSVIRHNPSGNGARRVLNKQIAVVLTKCDEPGLIDPDDQKYKVARQGMGYNRRSIEAMGGKVEEFMKHDLGFDNLVNTVHQSFRHWQFFSASALGAPPRVLRTEIDPEDGREKPIYTLDDPRPRHTVNALLWILRQWKYI